MKTICKPRHLVFFAAISGAAGQGLRRLLYAFAVDEGGLLTAGHPLEILLWLLTAAVTAVILLSVARLDGSQRYEHNFSRSPGAGLGHFVMAGGILVTVLFFGEGTSGGLRLLWKGVGFLSVPCLIWAGIDRWQGRRPLFWTHFTVCVFFVLHMLSNYQNWSRDPQLQDYVFELLCCACLALFAYQLTAFDVGSGRRRMTLGVGLLAVYLGFVAAPGSSFMALYLFGTVWCAGSLRRPEPVPRRRTPRPGQEQQP